MDNRLNELLQDMDIPKNRITDLHWLSRNLGVRNKDHENFTEALDLIKQMLRQKTTIIELEESDIGTRNYL